VFLDNIGSFDEEFRFTQLGVSRSAMLCIVQAAQRRRWAGILHPGQAEGIRKQS